ncbi:hypothetical protein FH972_023510 [Carpinus fangiana]|uniref:3-hydroxyisobutyrate dehydrogenase n=1 Tax=Carpinus fangiana TaxID=176857 RepID=A0A5N6KW00_9ROSI|nr:hypothetical protein FH972_023510 [Carpinus fangiana]
MATSRAIGFIGLGAMGYPMAENLIKKMPKGSKIYVFDLDEDCVGKLCSAAVGKAEACANARQVAERSEIILSMVPEGSHVREVYLNPSEGALLADLSNKLVIDCSTIDTATSLEIRTRISEKYPSANFYDAPVSGGVLGAQNASMTFMLGCAEDDPNFSRIHGLLSLMGGSIFACGGPTLGLTAKLCNNYCSGLIAIATAEALNIGIRAGMDPRVLAKVFSTSLAQSCINDKFNPVPRICPDAPSSHDYKPGFKVGLMRKDFALAVDTAERVGANLALGEKGLEVYTGAMQDERCKGLDSRVVYRYLGGDEEWEQRFA